MLGLEGERPEEIDTDAVPERIATIVRTGTLRIASARSLRFVPGEAIVMHRKQTLPRHPNGMRFTAMGAALEAPFVREYYSVGGGFVVNDSDPDGALGGPERPAIPYPFRTGAELLEQCDAHGLSVATLMLRNEATWRSEREIRDGVTRIWNTMQSCVQHGCVREGILPGGLKVRRRAAALHRRLRNETSTADPLIAMDWVNLWALAVNEENAAGGRVVTAPTNGAAGIIPAVLHYYRRFVPNADDEGVLRFLLAAGAIGMLYKMNASISGAEVGCQGEVGVACSMAAAGLAEALGGTPEQVENAAEIGMEHNLGLTCDPIGGLVQVPCIERNAMGSVKAINAARLALSGDGKHKVSLDKVIATMRQTGADMMTKYKETARGGLAVNIIEC
jgi:L-serine dehydratase